MPRPSAATSIATTACRGPATAAARDRRRRPPGTGGPRPAARRRRRCGTEPAGPVRTASVRAGQDRDQVRLVVGVRHGAVGRIRQRTVTAWAFASASPSTPTADHGTRAQPVCAASIASSSVVTSTVRSLAEGQRVVVQRLLVGLQRRGDRGDHVGQRGRRLRAVDPADHHGVAGGQVARADLDADRDALELGVDGPAAERDVGPVVELDPDARAAAARRAACAAASATPRRP